MNTKLWLQEALTAAEQEGILPDALRDYIREKAIRDQVPVTLELEEGCCSINIQHSNFAVHLCESEDQALDYIAAQQLAYN